MQITEKIFCGTGESRLKGILIKSKERNVSRGF